MKEKIKIIGVLVLAGFSFFYTKEVSNIIKNNDPIMKQINDTKKDMAVSKVEPIMMNDEYITGIGGCVVDEAKSYNKMKDLGIFNEELIVMKEDEIEENNKVYIIGGNKKNRNVSIILLNINEKLDGYLKEKNIRINYFLDGKYISDNIDDLMKINKHSNIYNYGRNNTYTSKYLVYDNNVINSNFENKSLYCLFDEKNDEELNLCSSYKMKSIKSKFIKEDILNYTKENLSNGKIFVYENNNAEELKITINYILSKGYNIISLENLLDESNKCN